jgi:hypothetical protein
VLLPWKHAYCDAKSASSGVEVERAPFSNRIAEEVRRASLEVIISTKVARAESDNRRDIARSLDGSHPLGDKGDLRRSAVGFSGGSIRVNPRG